MNETHPPKPTTTPRDGVPVELIEELDEANQQFHKAREHVEEANEALVNPTDEKERASHEVGVAEKAVEAVEEKIKGELKK
jgi:hypothetical protein